MLSAIKDKANCWIALSDFQISAHHSAVVVVGTFIKVDFIADSVNSDGTLVGLF